MAAELDAADPLPALEHSILRSLRRIQQIVGAQGRRTLERHRVTMPQLLCLKQLGALGTTTPSTLARRLGVSHATVTGMIDRLQGRGLVARSRSSVDKRNVMLELTARGRALEAAAPLSLPERLAGELARRPPRWRATIDLALRELVEMMGRPDPESDTPPLLGADALDEPGPLARGRNEPEEDPSPDDEGATHGE